MVTLGLFAALGFSGCETGQKMILGPADRLLNAKRTPFFSRYPAALGWGIGFVGAYPLSLTLVPILPEDDYGQTNPDYLLPSYYLGGTLGILIGTPFDLLAWPFYDHTPEPLEPLPGEEDEEGGEGTETASFSLP